MMAVIYSDRPVIQTWNFRRLLHPSLGSDKAGERLDIARITLQQESLDSHIRVLAQHHQPFQIGEKGNLVAQMSGAVPHRLLRDVGAGGMAADHIGEDKSRLEFVKIIYSEQVIEGCHKAVGPPAIAVERVVRSGG